MKETFKKLNLISVVLLTVICLASCSKKEETKASKITVESISLNTTSGEMKPQEEFTLVANILPENAENKKIIWKSKNEEIATVDQKGKVTAIAEGKTTITAYSDEDNSKVADFSLTVKKDAEPITIISVESISITSDERTIKEGESITVSAKVLPENASNKTIIWTSDNIAIATFDNTGKLQGLKAGKVKIKATTQDGNKIAECEITVTALNVPLESISLNYTGGKMQIGSVVSLNCQFTPNNTTNKTLKWTSSNTEIATVAEDGKITFIAIGEVSITATSEDGNKTATYTLKSLADNICYIPNENFKKELLDYEISHGADQEIDTNKDGEISYQEALAVEEIYLGEKEFTNTIGLENFVNLKKLELYDCKITSIDVSKLVNLTNLDCGWNKLTSIDVSKNIKLDYLNVYGNHISNLDISKCTELTKLNLFITDISSIDFSQCTKLKTVSLSRSKITSVDISMLTDLEDFKCMCCVQLKKLDVSKNTKLKILDCMHTSITTIDLTMLTDLEDFRCKECSEIKELDVSRNTKLKKLDCTETSINGNIYVFDKNLADTSKDFKKNAEATWVEKK